MSTTIYGDIEDGLDFDNNVPRTLVTLVMSKWHDNN